VTGSCWQTQRSCDIIGAFNWRERQAKAVLPILRKALTQGKDRQRARIREIGQPVATVVVPQ